VSRAENAFLSGSDSLAANGMRKRIASIHGWGYALEFLRETLWMRQKTRKCGPKVVSVVQKRWIKPAEH
jgi:hypothetical protein